MANTPNYNYYKPNRLDNLPVDNTLANNFTMIDNDIKNRANEITALDNRVDTIIAQSGTSSTEVVDSRSGFTVLRDRLDSSLSVNIKSYGVIGDDVADDGSKIQQAINDVSTAGGGTVFFPKPSVKYRFSTTLTVPENVFLKGIGEGTTTSRLHYVGSSWAVVTTGKHQRNQLKHLRFDLNGTGNGVRLGDITANLNGNIPIQFCLENVTFENIASGFVALQLNNVSHINLRQVRIGFGTITGGNALKITADGFNSGVFKAEDCTFGRVDATDKAIEIDGSVNLDSYNFDSCYIGGQQVRIGENTVVRSVNFEACHGEFRLLPGSALPNVDSFRLFKVYGGTWIGGTITCFGAANSNAFRFGSDVKKFNIQAVEANGVMGSIYLQDGSTTVEGCILQEANLTNGSTATQYTGVSDQNFKLLAKRFQTENINVKTLFSVDGSNKQEWGSTNPASDTPIGWTRGDRRWNKVPSELGTAGSKYVVNGWICTGTGTPGTWVEMRSLTGN
jgi:hypothetical protein